jgi:hypothetical protein
MFALLLILSKNMKNILLFIVAFTFYLVSQAQINSSSFDTKVDFVLTGNGAINLATGDMDGDGKKDVVVANQSTGEISIFRSTTTSGSISFSSRIDSSVGGNFGFIYLNDLDGDGKLDIVASTGINNKITVYRNMSTTPGTILIGAKQTFAAGNNVSGMGIGDLDGDNKIDIVVCNYTDGTYSIFRNNSTSGTISFATAVTSGVIFSSPSQPLISDLDVDGKNDLVILNTGSNNIKIYQNTTTSVGSISFSTTAVTVLTGSGPHRGDVSDIDGDGKPDIVCSNYSSSNTSVFRNTSTSGSISFASKVDFAAPNNIQSSLLRDLDADGKPELIQSTGSGVSSKISIYRNFAISGTISASSFGARVDISSANQPTGLDVADIDGDGNQDILSANFSASSFSVFRNLTVPSNGLVAYYPFNGNTNDSTEFNNDGTKYSGATLTSDSFSTTNSACYFNGSSNAYISVPASASINTDNMKNFTFSCWFKASGSVTPTRRLFNIQDGSTRNYELYYNYTTNKLTYTNWNGSSASVNFIAKKTTSTGIWYHATLRIDSLNNTQLFINGVIDTFSTNSITKPINPSLTIGTNPGSGWNFSGSMDEIRIYNRYVSNAEIQSLYLHYNGDINTPITKYYSNNSGYLDSLSTWGNNPDGSGTHPLSFDSSNTIYNVVNNASPSQSADWIVTGVNTAIVFGDGSNSINMSVPSAFICGADSIYIRNGVTYTVDGTLFYNKLNLEDGSTVQYLSTGAETLIPVSYSNLVVYGGTKSISGNNTVRGTLAMIADIDCGGDTLTLGRSASQTGTLSYTSGAIKGAFSRWFATSTNSASTGLFPMGSSSQYNPIQVEYTTAPTSGGVLTAMFTSPTTGTIRFSSIIDFSISPAVSLKKVSPDGFWTITPSKGLTGGTYKAIATATGFSGISSISGLRLLRRDNSSSAWTLPSSSSAIAVTGSTSSPVVGRSGLGTATSSRDFGIAADSTVNALPVELISFEGNRITDNNVLLNWVTSQEFNNDHFEIERLTNTQWNTIGRIKGNINSTQLNNYTFIDEEAFHKTNTEYYRLKQVDIDGNYEYSQTISVSSLKTKQTDALVVFPNPSNGSVTIKGLRQEAIVRDALGNEVYRIFADGIVDITPLKQGVYFIQSGSQIQKLIKY